MEEKPSKKKILHADNDQKTREKVKKTLECEGYEVASATTGKECLEMLPIEKPSLVLLETTLPDTSGWEILQEIKKTGGNEKVAFLTSIDVPKERKNKLEEEGISAYILKPVTPEKLLAEIRALMEIQE